MIQAFIFKKQDSWLDEANNANIIRCAFEQSETLNGINLHFMVLMFQKSLLPHHKQHI